MLCTYLCNHVFAFSNKKIKKNASPGVLFGYNSKIVHTFWPNAGYLCINFIFSIFLLSNDGEFIETGKYKL
jgi:hypothetical protein